MMEDVGFRVRRTYHVVESQGVHFLSANKQIHMIRYPPLLDQPMTTRGLVYVYNPFPPMVPLFLSIGE